MAARAATHFRRHRHPLLAAVLALGACTLPQQERQGASSTELPTAALAPVLEKLGRGAVAVPSAAGVLVSWRLLATDPAGLQFRLYRDGQALTPQPQDLTQFLDVAGQPGSRYELRTVLDGAEAPAARTEAWAAPFRTVPLRKPAGGVTPDGVAYTYTVNDGSAADLDGDGEYELVIKWQPTNAKDNSQRGHTGNTYIDAYKLDGRFLWRVDLGRNIRAGAHYTSFLVFDFDGDGRAELMAKTADGTVDGQGQTLGDANADHRNAGGYVLAGPEWLTVFNGQTGAALASTDYLPGRGDVGAWGDTYGNRVDRFLAGVAYLDGRLPSAVFARGYYTRAALVAWDWRDGRLSQRWVFDTDVADAEVRGQGAHWFSVADVDGDGRQDIVYGAATIGSEGRMRYSTGLCHGDALHVGRHDPSQPGLQVFMVHESPRCYGEHGVQAHDAATGRLLWSHDGGRQDVGRGVCMDIDAAHWGNECWASAGGLHNAQGQLISRERPRKVNFGLWWDGDLLRESLDDVAIDKWNPATAQLEPLLSGTPHQALSNNGTKATPVLSADLFGDWREEVVWRRADNEALLVFSTALPTAHRRVTLMHDLQYRVQVAAQNAGYNQPPHPSFFLGAAQPQPSTSSASRP